MKKITVAIITALSVWGSQVSGQSNAEQARAKLQLAMELMDQGDYGQSVALLDEAAALDPDSFIYFYEKGYAYYLQDDFPNALRQFQNYSRYEDATDAVYKMIGNIHDIMGHPKKALNTYAKGLEKFPRSGLLHFESGLAHIHQGDHENALKWYESGIEADPLFPSNYYYAALLRFRSANRAYAMVQAETFINLEPDSERTAAMSRMIYDAYRENIGLASDSTMSISFSEIPLMHFINSEIPFTTYFPAAYEAALVLAVDGEPTIDLSSLNNIRSRFLDIWYAEDLSLYRHFFSPLFDFQYRIREAGHFEAYNYWLMADGDPKTFGEWHTENKDKHDAFIDWFNSNQIILD